MENNNIFDIIGKCNFTFSANCRSFKLKNTCHCWRCREERGEEKSETAERLAELQAFLIDSHERQL